MKKKVLSILLTAAMVMSMAVGCGSNKSASTDAKDDTKTESSADGGKQPDSVQWFFYTGTGYYFYRNEFLRYIWNMESL